MDFFWGMRGVMVMDVAGLGWGDEIAWILLVSAIGSYFVRNKIYIIFRGIFVHVAPSLCIAV